jgi:NAD(P)-dependent dehydrogenase (short-subunit alcohol dehydrogenase family)
MQNLNGQVAIITGAAGNLGQATARAFGAAGARLALVDRNPNAVEMLIEALEGAEAAAFGADLMRPDSVAEMVAGVKARFGGIDILINIAGGFTMGPPVHETPDRDWDFMMDLNARTVFNSCRAVVPHLIERSGGRIVNVSARVALEGRGQMAPYCASKAAVITLTESLAAEVKDAGITVNCILPGTVDTPQNREAMPDQDHGRWVPPAALADVILFLASDAARCVNGAAVPVYGRS